MRETVKQSTHSGTSTSEYLRRARLIRLIAGTYMKSLRAGGEGTAESQSSQRAETVL